jgi:hypothetical protein
MILYVATRRGTAKVPQWRMKRTFQHIAKCRHCQIAETNEHRRQDEERAAIMEDLRRLQETEAK